LCTKEEEARQEQITPIEAARAVYNKEAKNMDKIKSLITLILTGACSPITTPKARTSYRAPTRAIYSPLAHRDDPRKTVWWFKPDRRAPIKEYQWPDWYNEKEI
jgi:hypothetical protein